MYQHSSSSHIQNKIKEAGQPLCGEWFPVFPWWYYSDLRWWQSIKVSWSSPSKFTEGFSCRRSMYCPIQLASLMVDGSSMRTIGRILRFSPLMNLFSHSCCSVRQRTYVYNSMSRWLYSATVRRPCRSEKNLYTWHWIKRSGRYWRQNLSVPSET
jgi:hypothetical protein